MAQPQLLLAILFFTVLISGAFSHQCQNHTKHAKRIVHGITTDIKEAKFYAFFACQNGDKRPSCGSTLVTDDKLIIAAHCMRNCPGPQNIKIYVGMNSMQDYRDGKVKSYDVAKIVTHPKYEHKEHVFNYDIAVVYLKTKVERNDVIQPISYATAQVPQKKEIVCYGYGPTSWDNQGISNRLYRATFTTKSIDRDVLKVDASKSSVRPLDGRIHDSHFTESSGGVARNIADALSKLGEEPIFLSAIGDDSAGRSISESLGLKGASNLKKIPDVPTAQCVVVFDKSGECKLLLGDMEIHKEINPDLVRKNEDTIRNAKLLILDGNCPMNTMETVLEMAEKYGIPVFYEPTDLLISDKPFKTPFGKAVKYISPNLNELNHIARSLKLDVPFESNVENRVDRAVILSRLVANYVDNVIVTLGSDGLVIARYAEATEPLLLKEKQTPLKVRHYRASSLKEIVNVSGSGDCLVAGLVCGMLRGFSEEICMSAGFAAAELSLKSKSAVPAALFNGDDKIWNTKRNYITKE